MCHLHRTHYPICRSTITTSITLCASAKRREQRRLAGSVEPDIWCTKSTSELIVNRFEVCWKCACGKARFGSDVSWRLADRMKIQRAESRGYIYPRTERTETDDGFWDSDAETLHSGATPPLRKGFALYFPPHMTHMRFRDAASMKRTKEAAEWLRGITMEPIRMGGSPNMVMTPKMDIVKVLRMPLRAPKVGRFHHMAFAKGGATTNLKFQNQIAATSCSQRGLRECQTEQCIPSLSAQSSLWRQGAVLERGNERSEKIRDKPKRTCGTIVAHKTPILFTPPSTPKLPETVRFEGSAPEQIKEWHEEDEEDKTEATAKPRQTEQQMDVARMQENAERMKKNTERIKENQKRAIEVGCPSLGYTTVMVENHEGEEKELTVGQICEKRRETLRILEWKQDVVVADKVGQVSLRPMALRPSIL